MKDKHGDVVISVVCLNVILNLSNILRSTVKGSDPATVVFILDLFLVAERCQLCTCRARPKSTHK